MNGAKEGEHRKEVTRQSPKAAIKIDQAANKTDSVQVTWLFCVSCCCEV